MFDRLDDMLRHYEELMLELNNPSVAEDQRKFRKLMKEQADLAPMLTPTSSISRRNRMSRTAWRFSTRRATRR